MPAHLKTKALAAAAVGAAALIFMLSREPDAARPPQALAEQQPQPRSAELPHAALPPQAPAIQPMPVQTPATEEDSNPDPYEIRGFVSPPADEGALHSARSEIKTGADMDYEAGLIDDDGNSTAVEIGSEEDEASLRQARIDEQLHTPPRASNSR